MRVAFIGLGNMGRPMALNLHAAGHEVTGFDTAEVDVPFPIAATAADAASGAEITVTMLPSGAILRAVADEVLPAMPSGAVLLDCSTVDVASARAVADRAAEAGIAALDAPVSGGTGGAEAGTLTFMVGGSPGAIDRAQPLLDIMGGRTVRCGAPGAGQAAKICNNMILGATMAATCEAIALGDGLGLDRQALFDVVSTSSGQSWSTSVYFPAPGVGPTSPADHDYRPGFAAALMLKDLRLSQDAAAGAGVETTMGAVATELYRRMVEEDSDGARDFSALLMRLSLKQP